MDVVSFEFIWRLRAVFCDGVTIENDPNFKDASSIWMWFAGDPHEDEWFAVALSDRATPSCAKGISNEINDREMAALLPYAGEPWDNIAYTSPAAFGSQQRTLYTALQGDPMARLVEMSREDIVTLRNTETPADNAWLN